MQRQVALCIHRVRIGMRSQQRACHRHVGFQRRPEKRRLAGAVHRARIRARFEKRRGEPRIFRKGRVVQHGLAAVRARIHIGAGCQQSFNLRAIAFLHRGVQRAVGAMGTRGEQQAERKLQYARVSSNRYHVY